MKRYDRLYVGGRWVAPQAGGVIEVVSPHTEEVIATAPEATAADADVAVAAARRAFDEGEWPRATPAERMAAVGRFVEAYGARAEEMSDLITAQNGSPAFWSRAFQGPGALYLASAFLDLAARYPWEEQRDQVTVRREPVGVVAAVVAWNVPQLITLAKLVPALLAGCTVIVKPAPETPLDALAMAEILDEAGLPEGVVSVLPGGPDLGRHLVAHPGVDKVAFTGSSAAGREIAQACGARLARCSLELGGKSALVVLDDAPLEATLAGIRDNSFTNSGQACTAQSRILVPSARRHELEEALVGMVEGFAVGDPSDPATVVGPMVSRRQRERVEGYIELGQREGGTVAIGGPGRPSHLDRGWYVRPTVFTGVDNRSRVAQEEIFGPVVMVVPYEDEADAVRLANETEYGLGGSVWTSDPERGMAVARRIRAGTCAVNGLYASFAAPFGGMRASGIGREWGPEGLDEYVELSSIQRFDAPG